MRFAEDSVLQIGVLTSLCGRDERRGGFTRLRPLRHGLLLDRVHQTNLLDVQSVDEAVCKSWKTPYMEVTL